MSSAIDWSPSAVTFLYAGSTRSRISSVADALIVLEGTSADTCRLSGLSPPLSSTDAANKAYVDSLIGGGGGGGGGGSNASFNTVSVTSTTDSSSPSTGALVVSGGVGVAKNLRCGATVSALAFAATSDARLKTKIRDASDAAERLARVHAKRYEFISQPGRERYGVLAQDLLSARVDGSVFRTDAGSYAVDYNAITALLLERVNALEERIRVLEKAN